MVMQCSEVKARKKQDIYLLRFIAVASIEQWKTKKVYSLWNSSWYFDRICWGIFYRRDWRHRVAKMLLKLKSILYPPDTTAINWRRWISRFILAVAACELCVTIKHFGWYDWDELILNRFSLLFPRGMSFWVWFFGVWVFVIPKRRPWKLRLLQVNKKKTGLKSSPEMVTQSSQAATARKNRDIYLLQFIAVVSGGYKIDFNFNNILATLCLQFLR